MITLNTLFIALALVLMRSYILAFLILIILLIEQRRFILPANVSLDGSGLVVTYPLGSINKSWNEFKSAHRDRNGILLSPFAFRSRLEKFRGTYILTNETTPDDAFDFIVRNIDQGRKTL
ncbi:MAG: hypothetical protein ABIE74_08395 [Pseudomonadota bacterium]